MWISIRVSMMGIIVLLIVLVTIFIVTTMLTMNTLMRMLVHESDYSNYGSYYYHHYVSSSAGGFNRPTVRTCVHPTRSVSPALTMRAPSSLSPTLARRTDA